MKAEIVICLGSSCFSRGNKKMVGAIKEFLDKRGLTQEVVFRGAHCFSLCEHGPVIRINGNEYRKVNLSELEGILDAELGPLCAAEGDLST
ncbi:MAG TPA: (2Fe-2S) ferredoxin domain-containing protein [Bacteroidales bacterium]|nr:(2Fe-2S) ferredoxin domain-containing protein [Bacteroidales bacterium]HRZ78292.1 (2Fe-2S) ferredoxin domain-containing protein [Bacteroidales bacterium]